MKVTTKVQQLILMIIYLSVFTTSAQADTPAVQRAWLLRTTSALTVSEITGGTDFGLSSLRI
jgi:hypothetical protein